MRQSIQLSAPLAVTHAEVIVVLMQCTFKESQPLHRANEILNMLSIIVINDNNNNKNANNYTTKITVVISIYNYSTLPFNKDTTTTVILIGSQSF